jgi:hypothetical protein
LADFYGVLDNERKEVHDALKQYLAAEDMHATDKEASKAAEGELDIPEEDIPF